MSDPKSTTWQIPYFVGGDRIAAIQEIAKIRVLIRKEMHKDKKYHENFGAHLDLFNSVRTPHECQSGGNASASISDALRTHQKSVLNLMSSGKEIWNLWLEWKDHVWKEHTSRYSVHDALHHEWTRVCMNGYTFSSVCDFAGFSFPNETFFDEAIFSSTASFNNTLFQQASFNNTLFQQASFDHATFSDNVEFGGAIFESPPSFVGATFSKDFRFDRAHTDTPIESFLSRFNMKSLLSRRAFARRDDSDVVTCPMQADFSGATFSQEVCFDGQTFRDEAKFSSATFAGGVSFLDTEFRKTADFAGATFPQKAEFSRSRFLDEANFENAVFSSETDFTYAIFYQPPVFHGAELHPSTAFSPGFKLWRQFKINKCTKGARDRFRTLRNHFKNQEAEFEANLFYALEMRATMREEWEARHFGRAALIYVYDKCTAFGLSALRPLAFWLVIQLIMSIFLAVFPLVNSAPLHSVISSISLAFLNGMGWPSLLDNNLIVSQIATVFQIKEDSVYITMREFSDRFPGVAFLLGFAKVLSIGFIFLTLLALRNRFRIK